ncbi:hypothetical protein F4860DRAFT_462740 [Xylaria cubensis]|nr:hypothetical protein F4860DRAFT_462740 [Xylaria cubensis]
MCPQRIACQIVCVLASLGALRLLEFLHSSFIEENSIWVPNKECNFDLFQAQPLNSFFFTVSHVYSLICLCRYAVRRYARAFMMYLGYQVTSFAQLPGLHFGECKRDSSYTVRQRGIKTPEEYLGILFTGSRDTAGYAHLKASKARVIHGRLHRLVLQFCYHYFLCLLSQTK